MCWVSTKKPVAKVAKEDIPVFKIVKIRDNKLKSFYRDFEYKVGQTYATEISKITKVLEDDKVIEYMIDNGFHSYNNEWEISIKTCPRFKYAHIYILEGDSYKASMFSGRHLSYAKLECVIPKGSKYYIDDEGEYVSNIIKVLKYDVLEILRSLYKRYSGRRYSRIQSYDI